MGVSSAAHESVDVMDIWKWTHNLSDGQKSLLCGGIAGSTGKTVTAPLSRMTVLLQVGAVQQCRHSGAIQSFLRSCGTILKTEGVLAFWKGNMTSVIHRFPYSAINFALYEKVRDQFCKDAPETPLIRFTAGGISGSIACAACYPLDLIKTRLAVDSHNRYRGIIGAVSSIVKHDGVAGLYYGLTASMLVVVPTLALSYTAYGTIKSAALASGSPALSQEIDGRQTITFMGGLLCGSLSGIVSTSFTFPFDLVRRNLQVQGFNFQSTVVSTDHTAMPRHKLGAYQTTMKIYQQAGFRGFFRGFFPEILKITPMVGITFSTFELCSQLMDTNSRL